MDIVVNKAIKEDSYYKRIGVKNVQDLTEYWNNSKSSKDLDVKFSEEEVTKFLYGCFVDGNFPSKMEEVSGWG